MWRVHCRKCGWYEVLDYGEAVQRLRNLGFLLKDKRPERDIVLELFRVNILELGCMECDDRPLAIRDYSPADDGETWGLARACQRCNTPISQARLDAVPDTPFCSACQAIVEKSPSTVDDDFCPKCGDRMRVESRSSRTGGYTMFCPSCRRSRSSGGRSW